MSNAPAHQAMSADPLSNSRALVQALRESLAAEHRAPATLIETHISWVLLVGPWAYKIKKPVRLSFVDFSTLAARRHFCDEELRLNRRFAPSLYVAVLPITGEVIAHGRSEAITPERGSATGFVISAPRLGGDGEPIEFALQMHRMRDEDLAGARLALGALAASDLERFAATLARWHREAPVASRDGGYGTPARVASDIELLLADWPHADDADAIADLRQWFAAQADDTAARASQRLAQGHVRECHGDLHVDNLAFIDGELGAFDALEFDPGLRWVDTISEVAFLAMDLQARQRPDLAHAFVDAYLAASGDADGVPLLRRYQVYRALVRARVSRLREAHAHSPARASVAAGYVALARRLSRQWDARLLVTHGLPGSGKTQVSGALMRASGAIRWRSDVERARLLGGGHYQSADSDAVYARLHELAALSLHAGLPTIVDAACLQRAQRDGWRSLATRVGVPFTLLSCEAPPAVLRQRVRERTQRRDDASEADEAVLELLRAQQQPLADDELAHTLRVDTSRPWSAAVLAAHWLATPTRVRL